MDWKMKITKEIKEDLLRSTEKDFIKSFIKNAFFPDLIKNFRSFVVESM